MLVEFLGVPGSGKSTVSHILADALKDRDLTVAEITYDLDRRHRRAGRLLLKSMQSLRFALKHPYKTYSYFTKISSTNQNSLSDFTKALFNWLFIASIAHTHRASDITILDQGVAQALWSVGHAARRNVWADLLALEPEGAAILPDLVVHVRASPQSLKDRLMARTQRVSRLDGHGQDFASLARARAHSDAIARLLQSKGVRVVEIDNDHPDQPAEGARSIADALALMRMNGRWATSAPVELSREKSVLS